MAFKDRDAPGGTLTIDGQFLEENKVERQEQLKEYHSFLRMSILVTGKLKVPTEDFYEDMAVKHEKISKIGKALDTMPPKTVFEEPQR